MSVLYYFRRDIEPCDSNYDVQRMWSSLSSPTNRSWMTDMIYADFDQTNPVCCGNIKCNVRRSVIRQTDVFNYSKTTTGGGAAHCVVEYYWRPFDVYAIAILYIRPPPYNRGSNECKPIKNAVFWNIAVDLGLEKSVYRPSG
jgi:hypothetical protein